MSHIVIRKILFALNRVFLVVIVVIVSRKTGESNLYHIYAAFVMYYNKVNKHVKLCHMINLDS